MRYNDYLAVNRHDLDTLVTRAADELLQDGDTDADRKLLARELYTALKKAIRLMLANDLKEGHYAGSSRDVAVSIYQPAIGEDLLGRFPIHAGRLSSGGTIPCPADWPRSGAKLPPFLEDLHEMIFRPKRPSRVLTLDAEGRADLGTAVANRQYMLDELPNGEFWLRPLEENGREDNGQ